MIRIWGMVALLASLGLAGFLALRVRHERLAGTIFSVNSGEVVFEAAEVSRPLPEGLSFRPLPITLPRRLDIHLGGTKSREWIGVWLRFPDPLPPEELRGQAAELRHRFLDLPLRGPTAGHTIVRVGPADWSDGPWHFWGTFAGIAVVPLLAWAALSLPFLLLRKRPA
jgi:hypothetical protein